MIKKSLVVLLMVIAPLSAMMEPFLQETGSRVHHGSKAKSFRILSIVGGAVRGMVPIEILSAFEKKTKKSISGSFNLITGSSSGGAIVLGLTTPDPWDPKYPKYSALDIKNYFLRPSSDFMTKNWFSFYGFLRPMYDRTSLENLWDTFFENVPLSQTTTGCMITAVDARSFVPYLFLKFPNPKNPGQTKEDYTRKDMAMATSAEPVYLKPHLFSSLDKKKTFLTIDGGISMNDPSIDALNLVSQIFKNNNIKNPIEIVTLTCGYKVEQQKSLDSTQKMGLLGWSYRFGDTFLGPNKKEKKELLEFLDIKNTYFNVPIPEKDYVSFEATMEQQDKLVRLTQEYLKNSTEFDSLVEEYRSTDKLDLDDLFEQKTK